MSGHYYRSWTRSFLFRLHFFRRRASSRYTCPLCRVWSNAMMCWRRRKRRLLQEEKAESIGKREDQNGRPSEEAWGTADIWIFRRKLWMGLAIQSLSGGTAERPVYSFISLGRATPMQSSACTHRREDVQWVMLDTSSYQRAA